MFSSHFVAIFSDSGCVELSGMTGAGRNSYERLQPENAKTHSELESACAVMVGGWYEKNIRFGDVVKEASIPLTILSNIRYGT